MRIDFWNYIRRGEWHVDTNACWICDHRTPLVVETVPLCLGCLWATRGCPNGLPTAPNARHHYRSLFNSPQVRGTPDEKWTVTGWFHLATEQTALSDLSCMYEIERESALRRGWHLSPSRQLGWPVLPAPPDRPPEPELRTLWPRDRARRSGILPIAVTAPADVRVDILCFHLPAEQDMGDLFYRLRERFSEIRVAFRAAPDDAQHEDWLSGLYGGGSARHIALHAARVHPRPSPTLQALRIPPEPAAHPDALTGREALERLLADACRQGASDIHIEPVPGTNRTGTRVRFRLHGDLTEVLEVSTPIWSSLIQAIKAQCGLSAGTATEPVDGRMMLTWRGQRMHVRVSIIPVMAGTPAESCVMRILHQDMLRYPTDRLGLDGPVWHRLVRVLQQPWGWIVIAGPTGSGKSTTFHHLIRHIPPSRKVLTIEDPVEYIHPGIVQCQVSDTMPFARAVRAFLRQDPDVMLVGEIRDLETARAAYEAALTGHLVLTTIHANSPLHVFERLELFGIDREMACTVLRFTATQRLLRRPCPDCNTPVPVEPYVSARQLTLLRQYDLATVTVRYGRGCATCRMSGWDCSTDLPRVAVLAGLDCSEPVCTWVRQRVPFTQIVRQAMASGDWIPGFVSGVWLAHRAHCDARQIPLLEQFPWENGRPNPPDGSHPG